MPRLSPDGAKLSNKHHTQPRRKFINLRDQTPRRFENPKLVDVEFRGCAWRTGVPRLLIR
jgi:hypothetical protein